MDKNKNIQKEKFDNKKDVNAEVGRMKTFDEALVNERSKKYRQRALDTIDMEFGSEFDNYNRQEQMDNGLVDNSSRSKLNDSLNNPQEYRGKKKTSNQNK